MIHQLDETLNFLENELLQSADVGIVLGTGLGSLLSHVEVIKSIPYQSIPHFPVSTVEFHKGNLVYGQLAGKKVMVMQGRFHFYEGYTMQQIVYPVRVMKMLGIKHLLLSNAAGGINPSFKKGQLVLLEDHINLQTANPLIGPNVDNLGPRFPDMSCPYNRTLNNALHTTAKQLDISLLEGVYAAVNGPNLETRAEYRYLKIIGADMVGMSTVPEVIAANHMQLPCAAISVITDECDPDNLQPVNIQEIIAVAGQADKKLASLMSATIQSL
jgi:purine-nucleoside phosphorylase